MNKYSVVRNARLSLILAIFLAISVAFSAPIASAQTVGTMTDEQRQEQIDKLWVLVYQLIEKLNQMIAQQSQLLQKDTSAPVFGSAVVPSETSVVVPVSDPSVASSIEVERTGVMLYGGSCGSVSLKATVKDQYGATLNAPITVNGVAAANPYYYSSPNFNTTDVLTFSANGRATTTYSVVVPGTMLSVLGDAEFSKQSEDRWYSLSTGNVYYPETHTCKR